MTMSQLKQKLDLSNEPRNVARILTLKKKQALKMNPELGYEFNLKEMFGLMHYKGIYYEVTFDTSDLKIEYLFPDGDYSNDCLENHLNDDDIEYMIKHSGLLRVEMME